MRAISLTLAICIFLAGSIDASSQSKIKIHAIQLTAYSSWDQMIEHRTDFTTQFYKIDFPHSGYNEENIYVEETGKWLKVYLIHDGYNADALLKGVKSKAYFKNAFKQSNITATNLFKYPSAYRMLSHLPNVSVPNEYTAKGGKIETAEKKTAPKKSKSYKIQLGVFKTKKSNEFISEKYGLKKGILEEGLSYDFVTVKKRIYRRYFFGHYDIEVAALAVKRQLEIKTGKKLLVVHK